ncbi:zinc finger protein 830-like [Chenopodium quinoa]|uniref:zinc finger protein 830-like n=1 Tax=Chenopodium quinoa TaxID=63459 RepID=UPI000B795F3D|nr:zinc finger protein 830-like [Chenopodium quinoa]XP_021730352.1 zinc finger protein 830-like [Chenopodium quinoa]XP_021730353.1 zinc finger protein 830-like [Chenopodium quinoa]XP_021730355.1 zinc finger protein 830-like [Chenopodium quinoa]XP_021730356.1 zinc finger protein 830-like [Chenopodium quinoa]
MADRDRKKALFRAKLNEKQRKNRIDSPLVRYNEIGKPVCRVCDFVLKSDSDWTVHQASRKHHEAINNLKASASKKGAVNNAKSETVKESSKKQVDNFPKSKDDKSRISSDVQKSRSSSALPADFFDHGDNKRQKVVSARVQEIDTSVGAIPSMPAKSSQHEIQPARVAENVTAPSETKQIGELPQGFFDNKEADLRARGIEPVKPDVKDEYKEFEKLIQEDLAEVDNRFEEEEIDAAEQIEEEEIVEQKTYRNKVEELKRKKMELLAARSSRAGKVSEDPGSKAKQDSSSSEDEDEDDKSFAVDWRAQHL